jgi:competence protein ComEA
MDTVRKFLLLFTLLAAPFLAVAAEQVNINTADKETLMTIKGVGERRAEAIIAYREEHGPFKSVEDLMLVQGIGRQIIEDNRETLTTGEKKQ